MKKKMDPKLVSKQKHEIAYLAKKFKTTQKVIRAAQTAVGRSRKAIEVYLTSRYPK